MKLDLKLIGENIRVARAVRSYSQDGLANKLGKSPKLATTRRKRRSGFKYKYYRKYCTRARHAF